MPIVIKMNSFHTYIKADSNYLYYSICSTDLHTVRRCENDMFISQYLQ